MVSRKLPELEVKEWDFADMENIPYQDNKVDCGVFVCAYAEYATRDAAMTFDQRDMPALRKKMEEVLIRGTLSQRSGKKVSFNPNDQIRIISDIETDDENETSSK